MGHPLRCTDLTEKIREFEPAQYFWSVGQQKNQRRRAGIWNTFEW